MVEKKIIEGFGKELSQLTSQTNFLLAIENRGGVKGFSIEEKFFDEIYPRLERLFYEIRGKGIRGKYIKE